MDPRLFGFLSAFYGTGAQFGGSKHRKGRLSNSRREQQQREARARQKRHRRSHPQERNRRYYAKGR